MRRVIYEVACSLDGYIARLDHSCDWIPNDGEDYGLKDFYARLDTALIGRKTHDLMVKHGQPAMPGLTNYVFSRNPPSETYGGVQWVSSSPLEFIGKLKSKPGKDIWLVGGSNIAQTLFESRLVDEVSLAIVPVLLGDGIPLFPRFTAETPLKLVEEKAYPGGVVRLRYECFLESSCNAGFSGQP
jgi:dihydrofolate reductase